MTRIFQSSASRTPIGSRLVPSAEALGHFHSSALPTFAAKPFTKRFLFNFLSGRALSPENSRQQAASRRQNHLTSLRPSGCLRAKERAHENQSPDPPVSSRFCYCRRHRSLCRLDPPSGDFSES